MLYYRNRMHLDQISEDILLEILGFCDLKSVIILSQTCKSLHIILSGKCTHAQNCEHIGRLLLLDKFDYFANLLCGWYPVRGKKLAFYAARADVETELCSGRLVGARADNEHIITLGAYYPTTGIHRMYRSTSRICAERKMSLCNESKNVGRARRQRMQESLFGTFASLGKLEPCYCIEELRFIGCQLQKTGILFTIQHVSPQEFSDIQTYHKNIRNTLVTIDKYIDTYIVSGVLQ